MLSTCQLTPSRPQNERHKRSRHTRKTPVQESNFLTKTQESSSRQERKTRDPPGSQPGLTERLCLQGGPRTGLDMEKQNEAAKEETQKADTTATKPPATGGGVQLLPVTRASECQDNGTALHTDVTRLRGDCTQAGTRHATAHSESTPSAWTSAPTAETWDKLLASPAQCELLLPLGREAADGRSWWNFTFQVN